MRTPQPAKSKKKLLKCSKEFEKKDGFTLRAVESAVLSLDGSENGLDRNLYSWKMKNNRNFKFVVF
jgi:hypothetical protein